MRRTRPPRPGVWAAVFVTAALALTGAVGWLGPSLASGARCPIVQGSATFPYVVANTTGSLNGTFRPGAIQGFGENGTAILYAGIGRWDRPHDLTLPELSAELGSGPAVNLTSSTGTLFHLGGVFGTVWNGTAWLVSGEATWGPVSGGVLASYRDGAWTNLSPLVLPHFRGGGVWAVAWNGSSWLLAGNSSAGAAMVELRGGAVTDLTGLLPHTGARDWIQLLAWNGTSWVVGGRGVFGVLSEGRYTDLLPGSPFAGGGVFGADWNGTAWVVGGGPPAAVAELVGTSVRPVPALPPEFDTWVNAVVATPFGWLLAGKGSGVRGLSLPELALWNGEVRGCFVLDLHALLPSSFAGGQVQFAGWAPLFGPGSLLLVGQGGLNELTGYSYGATAVLELPPMSPGTGGATVAQAAPGRAPASIASASTMSGMW